jgi:hypothetical protein
MSTRLRCSQLDAEAAAATMSHLQGKIAEARAKLMSTRVVIAAARNDLAAARAGLAEALAVVIHVADDEDDDDDMGIFPGDVRRRAVSAPMRSDDSADPSGHAGGQ